MSQLGNLVRLVPLGLNEIPFHPALVPLKAKGTARIHGDDAPTAPQKATQTVGESEASTVDANGRPNLKPFIGAILDEATLFVDDVVSVIFKPGSQKSSPPSTAKVQLLRHDMPGGELAKIRWKDGKIPREMPDNLPDETWFARRSRHANRQEKGTARFSEFDYGLRIDHSEHEGEYTPDVFDTYKVLDWKIPNESAEGEPPFRHYRNVTMSIYEMCHKLPFPLSTRVFPVLVIAAKTGTSGFIIVQIPVSIETLPEAFYSNGRNLRDGDTSLKRKKPILGIYTSIERCTMTKDEEIEWTMATASNANGWLPDWAQRTGIPGAIAKDVGFFMKWIEKKRAEKADKWMTPVPTQTT